jgi:hypothetical protein
LTRHLDASSAIATAIMQSTICCLIINHELNLDSRVAHVHVVVSADTDVYDLTEMIKVKHPANLVHVDADRLEVWKLNDLAIYKKKQPTKWRR